MDKSHPVTRIGSGRGLSYPERFHAAASYAGFGPHATTPSKRPRFDADTDVLLYALFQQATVGPCNVPQPRGWNNKVEQGKWNSWYQLGKMANTEAMRLFVKILEEEDPAWLSKVQEHDFGVIEDHTTTESTHVQGEISVASVTTPVSKNAPALENGSFGETEDKDILIEDPAAVSSYDTWFAPQVNGRCPSARYQHAAAVFQGKMFIVGGNHNGRYLSDVHVFNLNTKTWSKVEQKSASQEGSVGQSFSPCAGLSLIQRGNSLLAVAGHSKDASDTVRVYSFDIEKSSWSLLKSYGKAPIARGGQSVTLVGSSLVMFGGEDSRRRLLNDLNILDLETMTWDAIEAVGTPPSPRADHTATVQANRYLLVFGGGSHSACFNDLHVLDLETMEWSQPQPQGEVPTPRAGHAGVTIGDNWYIVGGGDNKHGVSETLVLDMSTMVWSVVTSVEGRTPIASEGLSVVATTRNSEDILVAFGGYNGRYINEVHIMKTNQKVVRAQPKILESAAAAAAAASARAAFSAPHVSGHPKPASNGEVAHDSRVKEIVVDNVKSETLFEVKEQLAVALKDKKELEATVVGSQTENSELKQDLAEAQSTNAEISKELHSVRGQLSAEQSRCFRLELEVAELRQKLQSMDQIHKELELLQRQKTVSDQAAATAAEKQNSGGLWGWIAGSAPEGKTVTS